VLCRSGRHLTIIPQREGQGVACGCFLQQGEAGSLTYMQPMLPCAVLADVSQQTSLSAEGMLVQQSNDSRPTVTDKKCQ
jgi:hypothetical protein